MKKTENGLRNMTLEPNISWKEYEFEGICIVGNCFDGFTTANRYMNFEFKAQSFAMKILMLKMVTSNKPMPMVASAYFCSVTIVTVSAPGVRVSSLSSSGIRVRCSVRSLPVLSRL